MKPLRLLAALVLLIASIAAAQSSVAPQSQQRAQSPAERQNELIAKINDAFKVGDWRQTEDACQNYLAVDPTRWQVYNMLGTAQLNLGEYEPAIKSFDQALALVSKETDSPPDPAKAEARSWAISRLLTSQGNAYLKLHRNDDAIRAYTRGAALAPDPARAYFNLCATQYNIGNTDGAMDACNKAIAADPARADAYFIKGSLMIAASKMDRSGKVTPPPGTAEVLYKYLELAPNGLHASDVKQMLQFIGARLP